MPERIGSLRFASPAFIHDRLIVLPHRMTAPLLNQNLAMSQAISSTPGLTSIARVCNDGFFVIHRHKTLMHLKIHRSLPTEAPTSFSAGHDSGRNRTDSTSTTRRTKLTKS